MKCIFCDIVKKDPHKQVMEVIETSRNINVFVFEPLNPCVNGHLLFVPEIHIDNMKDKNPLTPVVTGAVAEAMSLYSQDKNVDFNMIVNNGSVADQTVFHQHFHFIPRIEGDNVTMPWSWQK